MYPGAVRDATGKHRHMEKRQIERVRNTTDPGCPGNGLVLRGFKRMRICQI